MISSLLYLFEAILDARSDSFFDLTDANPQGVRCDFQFKGQLMPQPFVTADIFQNQCAIELSEQRQTSLKALIFSFEFIRVRRRGRNGERFGF